MQVNWNYSNFGQFKVQSEEWVFPKLGKQQRLKLSKLFESGKTKSSLLEVLPPSVQLRNGLLKNLRRDFTQFREFLLSFGQVVKLLDFSRELQFRRKDVLFFQGASIYQALTTITPILYLSKCVVIGSSTDFQPLNELLFLSGVWIDSVAVGNSQHSTTILLLLVMMQPLTVNLRGSIPLKLT